MWSTLFFKGSISSLKTIQIMKISSFFFFSFCQKIFLRFYGGNQYLLKVKKVFKILKKNLKVKEKE